MNTSQKRRRCDADIRSAAAAAAARRSVMIGGGGVSKMSAAAARRRTVLICQPFMATAGIRVAVPEDQVPVAGTRYTNVRLRKHAQYLVNKYST